MPVNVYFRDEINTPVPIRQLPVWLESPYTSGEPRRFRGEKNPCDRSEAHPVLRNFRIKDEGLAKENNPDTTSFEFSSSFMGIFAQQVVT